MESHAQTYPNPRAFHSRRPPLMDAGDKLLDEAIKDFRAQDRALEGMLAGTLWSKKGEEKDPWPGFSMADATADADINYYFGGDTDTPAGRQVLWARVQMTSLERRVFKLLGGAENPWLFIPQVEILGFIADFYSPRHKVVIEADGPSHAKNVFHDRHRDRVLLDKKGIRTLRLTTADIKNSPAQSFFKLVEAFTGPDAQVTAAMLDGYDGVENAKK